MIFLSITIAGIVIADIIRRYFHRLWVHQNKMYSDLVDRSSNVVNKKEAEILVSAFRDVLIDDAHVVTSNIDSSQSETVIRKINDKWKIEFLMPSKNIQFEVLVHEIGHGILLSNKIKENKKPVIEFFNKHWLLKRLEAALGFEYQNESMAWACTGYNEDVVDKALVTYKLKQIACMADLVGLVFIFLAISIAIGSFIG